MLLRSSYSSLLYRMRKYTICYCDIIVKRKLSWCIISVEFDNIFEKCRLWVTELFMGIVFHCRSDLSGENGKIRSSELFCLTIVTNQSTWGFLFEKCVDSSKLSIEFSSVCTLIVVCKEYWIFRLLNPILRVLCLSKLFTFTSLRDRKQEYEQFFWSCRPWDVSDILYRRSCVKHFGITDWIFSLSECDRRQWFENSEMLCTFPLVETNLFAAVEFHEFNSMFDY